MSRRNTDHVVMDARTHEFACRHCGARRAVLMPMPISDFVSQSRAFTAEHAGCPKPSQETAA
jgi:hypothetical protein